MNDSLDRAAKDDDSGITTDFDRIPSPVIKSFQIIGETIFGIESSGRFWCGKMYPAGITWHEVPQEFVR